MSRPAAHRRYASATRAINALVRPLRPRLRDLGRGLAYGFKTAPWGPMAFPPGHYHSTLPSTRDIADYHLAANDPAPRLPAIDLRLDAQIALLHELQPLIDDQPFEHDGAQSSRYHFDNTWFPGADAVLFSALLRNLEPRRIIEVGSGWSTAAMLDSYEGRTLPRITLVEPHPERLFERLAHGDHARVTLLECRLQDVPIDAFASLDAGDVLFVDSTHVTKLGSDVNYLFFDILPVLAPGVYVHLHDIHYPFEYPLEWVDAGWGWNEAYLLRAFLEFNDSFEIVLWNHLLQVRFADLLAAEFPVLAAHDAKSIWLRRRA